MTICKRSRSSWAKTSRIYGTTKPPVLLSVDRVSRTSGWQAGATCPELRQGGSTPSCVHNGSPLTLTLAPQPGQRSQGKVAVSAHVEPR